MTKISDIKSTKTIAIVLFAMFATVFSLFFGALDAYATQSPSVTTHSATEIGSSSAKLNGYFDPHGTYAYGWFEWGTSSSLGNSTATTGSSASRQFDRNLSGLSANTTYYFRAVAENAHGKEYGQVRSFTTGSGSTVSGELYCDITSLNSIVIGYNFSGGSNVSLFRENTRINGWSWSSASGKMTDSGLAENTSYRYYLRNGTSSSSPLIDSVLCKTDAKSDQFEDISIKNLVKRVNDNTWMESVTVAPGSIVEFRIEVRSTGSSSTNNVVVRNILPDRIEYYGNLRLDGSPVSGNVETGLNIGNIAAGSTKVVTFEGRVLPEDSFGIGSTNLINSAFASGGGKNVNDTAGIFVVRGVVAGAATNIKTGITDNKFIDFILLPLLFTAMIFLLFKRHFSGLAEWMESKKDIAIERKAEKKLDEIRELAKLKERLN